MEEWDGIYEVEFSDRNGVAYAFAAVPAEKLILLYYQDSAASATPEAA